MISREEKAGFLHQCVGISHEELLAMSDKDLEDRFSEAEEKSPFVLWTVKTLYDNGEHEEPDRPTATEPGEEHLTADKVQSQMNAGAEKKSTTTLLVLIAALCKHGNFDREARGAPQRLREMVEALGIRMDDGTIRKWLERIDDALENRGD